MKKGSSKHAAIIESLRVNYVPVLITSMTTIIGFLSMNFSDSPPFRDLGNLTSIGMVAAFLFSVLTLPAMLAILPVRIKEKISTGSKLSFLERLSEFVIAKKQGIVIASVILVIGSTASVFRNELNDEFIKYFSEDTQFRQDTDFISENLTGIYTMEFSLGAGESGGINNPAYLQKLKEFEEWLYTNPEVIHVNAFTDIMKHVNKSMHGDDMNYFKIPESREEAAQYLLLYEMSLPFGLDLNNQINVDKSESRMIVTLKNISTKQMLTLSEAATTWLVANTPDYMHAEGMSSTMMFAHLSSRQIKSMITGTILALILISIVLGFTLKSTRFGFLSLIPNIMPVVVGLGVWGLFYGYINTGISVVFGMTLGIIVDDTVHFLSKYLRARRELNKSPEDAVRYAFSTVGQALLVTSFVLIAGFMVLAQSDFGLNSDMALITSLIIFIALVFDFLLLPALLLYSNTNKEQVQLNDPIKYKSKAA
jgi:predicted RND superfamily exporter protein